MYLFTILRDVTFGENALCRVKLKVQEMYVCTAYMHYIILFYFIIYVCFIILRNKRYNLKNMIIAKDIQCHE